MLHIMRRLLVVVLLVLVSCRLPESLSYAEGIEEGSVAADFAAEE